MITTVHYQKGKDKYSTCCNTPIGVRGLQTTTANKEDVTCPKCRKMLSPKGNAHYQSTLMPNGKIKKVKQRTIPDSFQIQLVFKEF